MYFKPGLFQFSSQETGFRKKALKKNQTGGEDVNQKFTRLGQSCSLIKRTTKTSGARVISKKFSFLSEKCECFRG
ncbi:hypothetical protein LEP1GSC060_0694 [Leptospira weilii serovar Ranarum str. ICFT]|uniref:Uncharacterized protein n=1 Tax=Leptospira weilii serovar Ranarum str. ICFT TaxID=1218598 RepID=N1WRA6_9LEPT|nr:hypothetical protein LEP1GSC060_0694 [Leptospira weilii serovar Ranarum str. ICFT]